jgi:hypothetical protein
MSKLDRLKELGEIYKSGIISEAEFKSLKKELLASAEEKSAPTEQVPEKKKVESSPPVEKKTDPVPIVPQPKTEKQNKELKVHFQDSDGFWETFQQSLDSPISYWRDYKSCSVSEWMDQCNNQEFLAYLNIIFENAPLLRGEYPCIYSGDTGMILTNYRLFVNMDAGLFIIPLCSLTSYKVLRDEKVRIKYNSNGESQHIDVYTWLLPEYVDSAKNAKQWSNLGDAEIEYLQYSFFDLNSRFNLNPPKVSYNYSRYDGTKKNNSKKGKYSKSRKQKIDYSSIGSKNVFNQVIFFARNQPHFLLILLYPWLAYWTFIGTCCCVNVAEGYKMRDQGLAYFTDTGNLFFILAVLLPFLIGLITAIRMIFNMIIGKHYPNGDHPWGWVPIISIAGYALVSWFFINSLFLIPTGDDISNNVQTTEVNSIEDAKRYAIGTWGLQDFRFDMWVRMELKEDGTCYYSWGIPKNGKWTTENIKLNWQIEKHRLEDGTNYYFVMTSEDHDFSWAGYQIGLNMDWLDNCFFYGGGLKRGTMSKVEYNWYPWED